MITTAVGVDRVCVIMVKLTTQTTKSVAMKPLLSGKKPTQIKSDAIKGVTTGVDTTPIPHFDLLPLRARESETPSRERPNQHQP